MKTRLLLGTRGSSLALAQANEVIELLKSFAPNMRFQVVPIQTKGDKMGDQGMPAIEGKSIFTKEIEESLARGEIDVAIHSMKDLVAELPSGFVIAAVPKRANPRDALVSRNRKKFNDLPGGARVGTSSPRRKAQLLAARGDFEVLEIRGNVETRLRKLKEGQCDAIVLAAAGLTRLGLEKEVTELISTSVILPAVGQGALAVETKETDNETVQLLSKIDHEPSHKAIKAERAFARKLRADCKTPIAAHAKLESGKLSIEGMVATPNGKMVIRGRLVSDNPNAEEVGETLANDLLNKGAAALLEVS
jgi:hydroxymethylbilane synthase